MSSDARSVGVVGSRRQLRGESGRRRVLGKRRIIGSNRSWRGMEALEPRMLLSGEGSGPIGLDPYPHVVDVSVSGSAWTPAFLNYLQSAGLGVGGYSIPHGVEQDDPLGWSNIDKVRVKFDRPIVFNAGDYRLLGGNTGSVIAPMSVTYDPNDLTVTMMFQRPLASDCYKVEVRDTVTAATALGGKLDGEWVDNTTVGQSGDGVEGGEFEFGFNVQIADITEDFMVTITDLSRLATFFGGPGRGPAEGDLNGDLNVTITDLSILATHFGAKLECFDFGDAPDQPYPTLLASNGARHKIEPGYHLGKSIDADKDGQPNLAATGDDVLDLNDDEDGVRFLSLLIPGQAATVEVTASKPGRLNAWIDFNDNGVWEAAEQIFTDQPLAAGANVLSFNVPNGAKVSTATDPTYARFRFNRAGGLRPEGPAMDGEVEDYKVFISERKPDDSLVRFPWQWTLHWVPVGATTPLKFDVSGIATIRYQAPVGTTMAGTFPIVTYPSQGQGGGSGDDSMLPIFHDVPEGEQWLINFEVIELMLDTIDPDPSVSGDEITVKLRTEPQGNLPNGPALGRINVENRNGVLLGDSFFDIFVDISIDDMGGMMIGNAEPIPAGMTFTAADQLRGNDVTWMPVMFWQTGLAHELLGLTPPHPLWDVLVTVHGNKSMDFDWGDAPDQPYPTLAINNGAVHQIDPQGIFHLGARVDGELDGQPTILADGDDVLDGTDDEDGVNFLSPIFPGGVAVVEVIANEDGFLNAWMDWNRNGVWEPGERVALALPVTAGSNILNIPVPATAVVTAANQFTYSRWRYTRDQVVLGPAGTGTPERRVFIGEVEDHRFRITERPAVEVDTFENVLAKIVVQDPQGNLHTIDLTGHTIVHVYFEGPNEGDAQDDDGDGRDEVLTEIVSMQLIGTSPLGPVHVSESATRVSLGLIEELSNANPGWLDLNPFAPGEADSFFDIWTELSLGAGGAVLHTAVPMRLGTTISHKPPASGETYQLLNGPIPLLDANGNPTGFVIVDACQTPNPEPPRMDFGDAPDTYPVVRAQNGARHIPSPNLFLGTFIDLEVDGQPSGDARGDDIAGLPDDEDGVRWLTLLVPGQEAKVEVTASAPGRLDAWIDFNRDGTWQAAERIFTSEALAAGPNVLSFTVPNAAVADPDKPTFSRFRLSSAGGLAPTGLARDGEVEDYAVHIFAQKPDPTPVPFPWHWELAWEDAMTGQLHEFEVAGLGTILYDAPVGTDDANTFPLLLPAQPGMAPQPGAVPDGQTWHIPYSITDLHLEGTDSQGIIAILIGLLLPAGQGGGIIGGESRGSLMVSTTGGGAGNVLVGESFFDVFVDIQVQMPGAPPMRLFNPQPISVGMVFDSTMQIPVIDVLWLPPQFWAEGLANELLDIVPPHPLWDILIRIHGDPARNFDWGDAPDAPYPTLAVSNGAVHQIDPQGVVRLGASVDGELDGQPTPPANGDDVLDGNDDEDGVTFLTPLIPGQLASVQVVANVPGHLNAWIDFNRNGVWEAAEQIFAAQPLVAGANVLGFLVPAGAIPGDAPTYSRWRFAREPLVLTPFGTGTPAGVPRRLLIGEVEDHLAFIRRPAVIETDHFPQTEGKIVLLDPQGNAHTILLSGPSTVEVYFEGAAEGDANDDDGDGLDEVDMRLVQMELFGTSPFGPVVVRLDPSQPSNGVMRELFNLTDGRLDVQPFGEGLVDSFFDVFVLIDVAGQTLRPAEFLRLDARISHKPPAPGETYQLIAGSSIPLLFVTGQFSGFRIIDVCHTPVPGPNLDWGDAPDQPYPTLRASNGAAHVIEPGFFLGASVEPDPDGQPDAAALGDDVSDGTDDEDGVRWLTNLVPGRVATVEVTAPQGGQLDAWIDFNRNGVWEPLEQLGGGTITLNPGVNVISFLVPLGAVAAPDATYARFRLSRNGGLTPEGLAPDGEVEDYKVFILEPQQQPFELVFPWRWDLVWEDMNHVVHTFDLSGLARLNLSRPVGQSMAGTFDYLDANGRPAVVPPGEDWIINYSVVDLQLTNAGGTPNPGDEIAVILRPSPVDPGGAGGGIIATTNSGQVLVRNTSSGDPLAGILIGLNRIALSLQVNFIGQNMALFNPEPIQADMTFEPPQEIEPDDVLWLPTMFWAMGRANELLDINPPHPLWDIVISIHGEPADNFDWGDAPDPTYPTLAVHNGAVHQIVPGLFLGQSVDGELDGQPNPNATGDDLLDGNDDEDGVFFLNQLVPGRVAQVRIDASTDGYLNAWIDYNRDGQWSPNEQVFAAHPLVAGSNIRTFLVPTNAIADPIKDTFSRWRFTRQQAVLTPEGTGVLGNFVLGGEVEDHAVRIVPGTIIIDVDGSDVVTAPTGGGDSSPATASWRHIAGLLSTGSSSDNDLDDILAEAAGE